MLLTAVCVLHSITAMPILAFLRNTVSFCAAPKSQFISSQCAAAGTGSVSPVTIQSEKTYVDPFNDVDLGVIFSKDGQSWRVPTFWRGGQKWTVRFAPPMPGEYNYNADGEK